MVFLSRSQALSSAYGKLVAFFVIAIVVASLPSHRKYLKSLDSYLVRCCVRSRPIGVLAAPAEAAARATVADIECCRWPFRCSPHDCRCRCYQVLPLAVSMQSARRSVGAIRLGFSFFSSAMGSWIVFGVPQAGALMGPWGVIGYTLALVVPFFIGEAGGPRSAAA